MAIIPTVTGFGGGVVLEGGADSRRTDELSTCDGYDIGTRGALIAARDVIDYVTINDRAVAPAPWTKLFGIRSIAGNIFVRHIAIGEGNFNEAGVDVARYLLAQFDRYGAASPIGGATDVSRFPGPWSGGALGAAPTPTSQAVLVTFALFPGAYTIRLPGAGAASQINVFLVNLGAREGYAANLSPGLYVVSAVPPATDVVPNAISAYDSLGTGDRGEYRVSSAGVAGGTNAVQLYFRGIAAYNGFAMGWGFDSHDLVNKEGPARLMFSNLANPLKWGNDQAAVGTDRAFTDSDAVPIGDGGETIRAGLTWQKRFWIGTDRNMHFLAGYGRDSFITDGANPVAKAENVLGPGCMIEGPDGLMYGIGENGLWAFDGSSFEGHHRRLRMYDGSSPGYWDNIWRDRTLADTYPGKTNGDLIWMAADYDRESVVIGIPHCSIANGGKGTDTVVVQFNVKTGGFTRQTFAGVQYTAGDFARSQRQYASARFFGTATAGKGTVQKYADPSVAVGGTGYIANPKPSVTFGPYALFGPTGKGTYRRGYLTMAWGAEVAAATIKYKVTPSVDGETVLGGGFYVSIGPTAPAVTQEGDYWLDTSNTDTNMGNSAGGAIIAASADYVLKARRNAAWAAAGSGGQKEGRATIPVAWFPIRGTRCKVLVEAIDTIQRWQIEEFSFSAPTVQTTP